VPHIVLSGSISLSEVFENMYELLFKDQKSNIIVRIEKYFINQPGNMILAKADAVDQKPQSFYIMVTNKEDKTTIRLDPITDPEKTDGVKIALALMAKGIQEIEKAHNLYVSKTNIQEFIEKLQEIT
jgi:predicted transposase YdaD